MKAQALLVSSLVMLIGSELPGAEPAATISVHSDRPGAKISPTMWGIFFEDINYGADGGLYPERIKNRSFEFPEPLMGWKVSPKAAASGRVAVRSDGPIHEKNPHYLRISCEGGESIGLSNEGFFGMGIEEGSEFTFSFQGRSADPEAPALEAKVVGAGGRRLGGGEFRGFTSRWSRYEKTFRFESGDPRARLEIRVSGKGALDIDLVSLFPKKTWKDRPRGLRADMVGMLADLKPGFLRFPGGCIVEGRTLAVRYRWKETIGPVDERRLLINRWNDEFKHRPAPDYFQSFGLGFFEYFQLCEDIGAEPLPILNCGMACQFNSGEVEALDRLDPYIQDALDLIEFANGPAGGAWGGRRAAMGHPEPFGLKFLGIGNEQWHQGYIDRYAAFAKALKARHPEIRLISSAGPSPDDERFHFAWPRLRELKADIVDEHCYAKPEWFLDNAARYDTYDRSGPKVFMGEYAAQSDKTVSVNNRNNWECALAEAAYMTGLERNADVVVMASYAPLFGHDEGWQWRPNLIWCDNLRVYGTPSYYVQQLFSLNRGDRVLPVELSGALPAEGGHPRFYATAASDERSQEVILKAVNASASPVEASVRLLGLSEAVRGATATVLAANPADENSFESPRKVAPVTAPLPAGAPSFTYTFKPRSLTLLRIGGGR